MSKKKNSVEYDLFADFGAVDEGNIIAGAVMQAVDETKNHELEKKSQRIEDFGEKIGGARKDLYAAYCDLIRVAVENEVEGVPLSKSFPAPNYKKILESGVESWKVDAVRALRDAIPLKPRKYSWLIRKWAEKVNILRDMSVDVLENKWTAEEFAAASIIAERFIGAGVWSTRQGRQKCAACPLRAGEGCHQSDKK